MRRPLVGEGRKNRRSTRSEKSLGRRREELKAIFHLESLKEKSSI